MELMVVLVIMGIMTALAMPKTKTMRDAAGVRAAKQRFGAYLASTRAAAIRQSLTASFTVSGNNISASMTQADGTTLTIGRALSLNTTDAVTLTRSNASPSDVIIYDPRGFETSPGSALVYVFTRNSTKDSICISKMGMIAKFCGQ